MSKLVRGAKGQGIRQVPQMIRPRARMSVDGVLIMIWGNESQHTDGGADSDIFQGPYYPNGQTAFNEDKADYAAAYKSAAAVRLITIESVPGLWGLTHMIPTAGSLPANLSQEGWEWDDAGDWILSYFQASYELTLAQLQPHINPTDIYLLVDNSESMDPWFSGNIVDWSGGYTDFKAWLASDTSLTIHETLFTDEDWLAQATLALDDFFS